MGVREDVEAYIDLGWYPVPLKQETKECEKGWKEKVYKPADFKEASNVGLRLVSDNDHTRRVKLVSIDCDSAEAVMVAKNFLPPTPSMWGRDSKPISQALYDSPFEKKVTFKNDETGKVVVEILAGAVMTMAPPSIHPNGERLHWIGGRFGAAPSVDPKDILHAARLIATSALLIAYYPEPGARHDWMLAASGTLRQLELDQNLVKRIVTASCRAAGDEKLEDRLIEVQTTFRRGEKEPTTGSRKLADIIGARGKYLITSLRRVWGVQNDFVASDKKIVGNNQQNIRSALEKMEIALGYNEFANKMVISESNKPWKVADDRTVSRIWLDIETNYGFRPSRDYYDVFISVEADKNPMHPVKKYLSELKWDGVPRVDSWLVRLGGAEDSAYTRAITRIMLVAAVRRVRQPGVKFDELLILESSQGKGKSTALRTLCPNPEWFSDDLPLGVDAKEVIERTGGKWIIEAAEMVSVRRGAQAEQLKGFLSRQVDGPVRLAYGRLSTEVARQFIIIGSTNSHEYLKDGTGNRRFWPVRVGKFDLAGIEKERDQIWAEAAQIELEGESIRLDPSMYTLAAIQQQSRNEIDPWEEPIAMYVDEQIRVDTEKIWGALGITVERRTKPDTARISSIMQNLGFKKTTLRDGKRVFGGWMRDSPQASLIIHDKTYRAGKEYDAQKKQASYVVDQMPVKSDEEGDM